MTPETTAERTPAEEPSPNTGARLSPLLTGPHAVDGAVQATGRDAGVAAHYGQPAAEQRALDSGTAVVDLSHRGVVTVTGPDRLGWLNLLCSQKLDRLAPGQSTETLLLDLQGRIEFDCHVLDDGTTTWLTVEPGLNGGLREWLDSMRFASRVEVADRTGEIAAVGATAEVPGWEEEVCWQDPWPHIGEGGHPYTVDPDPGSHPGADWHWNEYLVPVARLESLGDELASGWRLAGTMAAEALRIAAVRPRHTVDTDDRTIPHEIDLVRTAVHLAKGCYKGQETIARVHNLGHPPRRLVFLMLDGSGHTLPTAGSDLLVRPEGELDTALDTTALSTARSVGRLTSVALHHEMGPIGLGVLKRTVDQQAGLLVRDRTPGHGPAEGPQTDDSGADGDSGDGPADFIAAAQEVVVSPTAGQNAGKRPSGFVRPPR